MPDLKFEITRGFQVDPQKTKPIDNDSLGLYKHNLINELTPYIDEINACNGYVAITVEQDGTTFRNLLVTPDRPDLFARIIDEVHSK